MNTTESSMNIIRDPEGNNIPDKTDMMDNTRASQKNTWYTKKKKQAYNSKTCSSVLFEGGKQQSCN